MILLALWGLALVATSIAVGRIYERIATDLGRARTVEEERIQRPLVTVTDGGWATGLEPADVLAFKREVLLDDEPHGRHDHRIAIGTSAQRARCHTITQQFHLLVGGTWSAAERAELEEAVT